MRALWRRLVMLAETLARTMRREPRAARPIRRPRSSPESTAGSGRPSSSSASPRSFSTPTLAAVMRRSRVTTRKASPSASRAAVRMTPKPQRSHTRCGASSWTAPQCVQKRAASGRTSRPCERLVSCRARLLIRELLPDRDLRVPALLEHVIGHDVSVLKLCKATLVVLLLPLAGCGNHDAGVPTGCREGDSAILGALAHAPAPVRVDGAPVSNYFARADR